MATSFSIAALRELFERELGVTLEVRTDPDRPQSRSVRVRPNRPEGSRSDYEISSAVLPDDISDAIDVIAFAPPLDFGPEAP